MSVTAESQPLAALRRANHVRLGAVAFRRRIAEGEVTVADILDPDAEIPDVLRSMPIARLLTAQRRWGAVRARWLLADLDIGERRRLDQLTARQRKKIVERLRAS